MALVALSSKYSVLTKPTDFRDMLYAEYQPLVRRLIRQYSNSPETSQDLAGEIYCRFCAILDAYDPERGVPLRGYIVRQLTASVYTYARQGWRRAKREIYLDNTIVDSRTSIDPSREWDDKLNTEAILERLPEAIAKVPKRQRQVVIWRYYEQRSFEEIALILKVQVSTTRSLLRHGLRNLEKYMVNFV